MKKIVCLVVLSLLVCGCDNKELSNNNINEESLKQIKESIESNKKIIEELNNKNKELEEKISALENEKEELKKTISSLESKDKEVDKTITDKYNELNKKIGSSGSLGSKYTITKEQLLGEWKNLSGNPEITFTDENLTIHDNWFEWNGMSFSYIYKNGKLYISDNGMILKK